MVFAGQSHQNHGMPIDTSFGLHRFWQQAEAALAAGRLGAARAAYQSMLALDPAHPGALLRLSTVATGERRYRASISPLLELARVGTREPDLLVLLAASLHRLGESAAARRCLGSPALALSQDRALLEQAAQVASQLEDLPRASALLDVAERFGGATPSSTYLRATLALFNGELDASGRLLESCIAQAPGYAQSHWALARLRRQSAQDNHVGRLQERLAGAGDPSTRAYFAFAFFKELDDLGETDSAWAALMVGCEAKRRLLAAVPAGRAPPDEATAFEALQSLWTPTKVATAMPTAEPGSHAVATPVFIVGMPRTGTTLLERILAGTGVVADAGELDDLPLQLRWQADRFSRSFLDAAVIRGAHASGERDSLGRRYLAHAAWRAGDKDWFTDKLPMNFANIGFIADALPQAPILHMVRNPMDTCLSNLKELFTDAYPYSYALDTLAAHYTRYRRLMAHWHRCYPGRILDVPYEGLVADPEAWTRRILAHCGIAWDPRCLDVTAARSAVTTASSVQVREPIHGRAVQAWRRYALQLEPLRQLLVRDGWLDPEPKPESAE